MTVRQLFGIDVPIIQAPMAGVQGSALAIAVSNAGGLGALPCAMLTPDGIRQELAAIRAQTAKPFNVNFFCHAQPTPDPDRDANWRATLGPYYREFGIDVATIKPGAGRAPFNDEAAAIIEAARPAVVSFHFGLPADDLMTRVRALGARIIASATTLDEARWLESRGVDAIIAQGLAAGGIANARGVTAMLTLGATAVQVGTAFLLCPEATTTRVHRDALKSDAARHTALTNVFT